MNEHETVPPTQELEESASDAKVADFCSHGTQPISDHAERTFDDSLDAATDKPESNVAENDANTDGTQDVAIINENQVTPIDAEVEEVDGTYSDTNVALPIEFSMSSKGLFFHTTDRSGQDKRVWICGAFRLVAEVRNFENASRGLKLAHLDREGITHGHMISRHDLAVDFRKIIGQLVGAGLNISMDASAMRALKACLMESKPAKYVRVTKRVGFQPDGSFVLPSKSIGTNERIEFNTPHDFRDDFSELGSLSSWKSGVSQFAVGNPFVLFAIATAFAGPLLKTLGADSPVIHMWGPSSTGKTTSARLAASVWGKPSSFTGTWRSTINAMEPVQDGRNDTLVVLDELALADPADVRNAAYMISTGQGKARMTKGLALSPKMTWRVVTLSTGEIPFETYITSAGQTIAAGQTVRFISVRADAGHGNGVWTDLLGFNSGHELALAAKQAADEQYGTAGVEFVRNLLPLLPTIQELHRTEVLALSAVLPPDADGQVHRVCNIFATIALAGKLASRLGIVAWTEEGAAAAAAICFKSWLRERGHSGSFEIEQQISMIRSRLASAFGSKIGIAYNKLEKYQTGDDDEYTTKNYGTWGFARLEGENRSLYVRVRAFKEDVCKGIPVQDAVRELIKRGHMIASTGSIDKVMHDPLTRAKTRCYQFGLKFLELPDIAHCG